MVHKVAEVQEVKFPIAVPVPGRMVARLRFSSFMARLAFRFWFVARILHAVGNRLRIPRLMAEIHIQQTKYRPLANVIPDTAEETGYTGDTEIRTFFNYRNQLIEKIRLRQGESGALYEKQIEVLSQLLESRPEIKSFFNFGVGYAYLESVLAPRFKEVRFVGIDRSPFTKALNEVEFPGIPNLQFESEDVFGHLDNHRYESGIFHHSRTGVLLNRPILENIYDKAYDAGFEYIAGFEQFGLSRQTLTPFEFTLDAKESVLFRQFMFIHNYPGLLQKAGFRVERFDIYKTDHPNPDFRMAAFVDRRDPNLRGGS